MRISRRGRGLLYSVAALLFLSGVVWFALDRFVTIEGEYGAEKHPLESWVLALHGGAAMAFLVLLGWLLPLHVKGGWRARLNRRSGATNLTWNGLLALSGYLLYYAGEERLRAAMSWLHLGLGLLLPAVLTVHILRGRAARRARARQAYGAEGRTAPR